MKRFFSQQGEDVFIFKNFINQQRSDGTYLEVGALDGFTFTNTKFFEDALKFKGILIEPLPNVFNDLVRNRPLNNCYNVAISNSNEDVSFIGEWATAGIPSLMTASFRKRFHDNATEEYAVPSQRLGEIIKRADYDYIDLMSIDVEGGEQEVLQSMDWDIPVYLICIETGRDEGRDADCRHILTNSGFIFSSRMCGNEFWYNPNYERKDLLYSDIPFGLEEYEYWNLDRDCVAEIQDNLEIIIELE